MTFPATAADSSTVQLLTGAELTAALSAITTAVNTLAPYLDGVEGGLGAILTAVNAPSGTQPLPTGAATSAAQTVLQTSIDRTTPGDNIFAITPGTSVLGTIPDALLVTAAGTLAVGDATNTSVSLGSVTVGQLIPFRARYVYATGTTATVVGLL